MSILSTLKDLVVGNGSGVVKEVGDLVRAYFPPDMPAEKRIEFDIRLNEIEATNKLKMMEAMGEAERNVTERVSELEGTAKDLSALPVLGRVMLFLRGSQRPIWGFATMYMDFQVFSGEWLLVAGKQESAFWVINFLVLGFLFGERALQNVLPIIGQHFGRGAQNG